MDAADAVVAAAVVHPRVAGGGEGIGGLFGQSDKSPERYTVCLRYNAKDFDGRYAGIKQGMAVYSRGRFDRFVPQPHGPCDEAEYKPFPELEALRR